MKKTTMLLTEYDLNLIEKHKKIEQYDAIKDEREKILTEALDELWENGTNRKLNDMVENLRKAIGLLFYEGKVPQMQMVIINLSGKELINDGGSKDSVEIAVYARCLEFYKNLMGKNPMILSSASRGEIQRIEMLIKFLDSARFLNDSENMKNKDEYQNASDVYDELKDHYLYY